MGDGDVTATNAARVADFHHAMGVALPDHPAPPDDRLRQLRQTLLDEEYREVTAVFEQMAVRRDDPALLLRLVHELCDLLYVTYGAILACGVDPDAAFAEVHRANMQKAGGPRRADGKVLKPPDWEPANLEKVLTINSKQGTRNS